MLTSCFHYSLPYILLVYLTINVRSSGCVNILAKSIESYYLGNLILMPVVFMTMRWTDTKSLTQRQSVVRRDPCMTSLRDFGGDANRTASHSSRIDCSSPGSCCRLRRTGFLLGDMISLRLVGTVTILQFITRICASGQQTGTEVVFSESPLTSSEENGLSLYNSSLESSALRGRYTGLRRVTSCGIVRLYRRWCSIIS